MASDPLSRLIESISAPTPPTQAAGANLQKAGRLVGEPAPTAVPDPRDSQLLATFRRQHAAGQVESAVLDAAIGLLGGLLRARGLIL